MVSYVVSGKMYKQISKTTWSKNMKKLLTAAVASTFAFLAMGVVNGDEINQGADFEASGFVSGEAFNTALDDEAKTAGNQYWYTEDTEADNIISNHSGAVGAPRPDMFASDANNKFLRVETTGKLWRSVKNNGGSSDFLTNTIASLDVYGYSITNSAIYLDTLVKFTPADGEFAADALADGDKIAISYVEHEADTDGDVSYTNFVIRAGLIRGELFQTNYFAYLPDDPTFANFDKDAWHRLTVRTIPDVGDGSVGFVVYVDETNLTYSVGVDAGFGTLNATAQGFYNGETHALFPSAREAGAIGGKTISAASFSGNGSLDDVVFTTTTPTFIASSETPMVTVTWDTDVISAITIAGNAVTGEDFAAGSKVVELEGTALAVTVTPVGGYDIVYSPAYENGEFTGLAAGDTCSITGFIPKFDVNGTHYAGLSDAISAAVAAGTSVNPATLKLLADCPEMIKFTSGYVVIDLAGHNIQGKNTQKTSISVTSTANVIVTNSVPAEGAVKMTLKANNPRSAMALEDTSRTAVYCVKFDGTINTGSLDETDGDFAIFSGVFLDEDADGDPAEFTYKSFVKNDAKVTALPNDYFQVGESGGSGGDEDWKDPSEITQDATAGDTYGITGDLAAADAVELTKWATGVGSVTFANKDNINVDCFLLNIANNSTAAQIQAEMDEFVVTISFDSNGDPVIKAPDGKTYNGKLISKGSDDLSIPKANWDEKAAGDTFFYGVLSL